MAVLYQDQYDAMRKLGTDETYVLSSLACGYDVGQITAGLGKRNDRDTKDDVGTIAERVYGKLGVSKMLKQSERFRRAGKIYFDYCEMLKEKRGPRPGKAPVDEPEPEHVDDDEVLERNADRFNGAGAKPDHTEGAGGQKADADTPAGPSKPAPGDGQLDMQKMASRVPKLSLSELRVLKALSENPDIEYVKKEVGLAEGTVQSYIIGIRSTFGLSQGQKVRKIELVVQAYRLYAQQNPEALARLLQPKAPENIPDEYDIKDLARRVPQLGPSYLKIVEAALQSSDITDISIATSFSESTIKLYLGHAAAKLGLKDRMDWQTRLSIMVSALKLAKANASKSPEDVPPDPVEAPEEVPADASPDQPAPQETFSLPNEGTVVNLVDPTSIEDVRVSTAAVVQKYREQGYVLEHIVLPVQGGFGAIMYIHVKRKKPV